MRMVAKSTVTPNRRGTFRESEPMKVTIKNRTFGEADMKNQL